jgi:hypothetical protein
LRYQYHIKSAKYLSLSSFTGFRKGRHIDRNPGVIQAIKEVSHTDQTGIEYKGQPDFKKQARVQYRVIIR